MNKMIEEILKESEQQNQTIKVLHEKIPEQFTQFEENLKLKEYEIKKLKSELTFMKKKITRYQRELKECKKQLPAGPAKLEKQIPILKEKLQKSAIMRKSLARRLGNFIPSNLHYYLLYAGCKVHFF